MKFYTNSFGSDENAVEAGLKQLIQLGKETLQAGIAVHQEANLEPGTALARALDPQPYAVFRARGAVTFNNVKMFKMTERNNATEFRKGPILALHVSSKRLKQLMEDPRMTDIVYIPWSEEERDGFKKNNPDAREIAFIPEPDTQGS
jgi:hypothetical protein